MGRDSWDSQSPMDASTASSDGGMASSCSDQSRGRSRANAPIFTKASVRASAWASSASTAGSVRLAAGAALAAVAADFPLPLKSTSFFRSYSPVPGMPVFKNTPSRPTLADMPLPGPTVKLTPDLETFIFNPLNRLMVLRKRMVVSSPVRHCSEMI